MSESVWINGKPAGGLNPADRGLAYGDGVFETIRLIQGQAVLGERHWARLSAACQYLEIPLNTESLRLQCESLWGAHNGIAKIIVTRGVGGRGYLPPQNAQATTILSLHDAPQYPSRFQQDGINAAICEQSLGNSPLLAGLKHLNRLEQVLLRKTLAADTPEGLVSDTRGFVVEGIMSNVFLVRNGALHTPLLDSAGVLGVMRAEIIDIARHLGISVTESHLNVGDFVAADEVFFCNSVYGIWPVQVLGETPKAIGPITRQLQTTIASYFSHAKS